MSRGRTEREKSHFVIATRSRASRRSAIVASPRCELKENLLAYGSKSKSTSWKGNQRFRHAWESRAKQHCTMDLRIGDGEKHAHFRRGLKSRTCGVAAAPRVKIPFALLRYSLQSAFRLNGYSCILIHSSAPPRAMLKRSASKDCCPVFFLRARIYHCSHP